MRVLSGEEFVRSLGAALEEALVAHGGLPASQARPLRWEILRGCLERIRGRARRVRGQSQSEFLRQLRGSHAELLRERERAARELEAVRAELTEARVAGGAAELGPAEEQGLQRCLEGDLRALIRAADAETEIPLLLARERARRRSALEHLLGAQRERIGLLERRLAKLRTVLQEMESALAELARRAELDPGLPSLYRGVQGLDPRSPQRERKGALLLAIFQQNLVLQRRSA